MKFFATDYTIHFDDTMAYGSHHFLTAFKFQCASREAFLFGEQIYDVEGVKDSLENIHLFTADAYSRNLSPARLGDRLAILLTLEEWGRASARFCYRVMAKNGAPVCAGFQTLLCADAATGKPTPMPTPLWKAMDQLRGIEEPQAPQSFRDRVLAGGSQIESLFGPVEQATAVDFLKQRYPKPEMIPAAQPRAPAADGDEVSQQSGAVAARPQEASPAENEIEAWVFSGQGTFDAKLLCERITDSAQFVPGAQAELEQCGAIARDLLAGDASAVISRDIDRCTAAVKAAPDLLQVAIYLQNALGAMILLTGGRRPGVLLGHSFGEIAALGVGGCFDLPTGTRIVCERVRAITEHGPANGGLLAVSAERAALAAEIAMLAMRDVTVAGRNHDQQTVASGPLDQLGRLREHLRRAGAGSVVVPSPTSFHHPLLRQSAAAWLARLRELSISPPRLPVYSPIGRRFIEPADDIALTLATQLLRPFDLQGAVADVIEAGVTKFVDCGSTGSLARILAKAGANRVAPGIGENLSKQAPAVSVPAAVRGTATEQVAQPEDSALQREPEPAPAVEPDRGPSRARPRVSIVSQGCILPGGATSPDKLFSAMVDQRSGIVDQRDFDPHWEEDFYCEKLTPDRSTSFLTGRVQRDQVVAPEGVDQAVFDQFTLSQQLLCSALAPCIAGLEGADRVLCLIGGTADGFEDQDVVSSLRFAGIDPASDDVDRLLDSAQSACQEPHDAIREVIDRIVRPGLDVIMVDAACASSLYAIALGMHALESGVADAVVAGGVFCPGPGNSCLFSQFGGNTSTGLRPFDADADGVVFSEGAAAVVMRRVADAERIGLPISTVLCGAGLSSDGRSPSANVPQTHGQILALQRCYENYQIDPASIDAVEAHGTSTPVGDGTEIETLRQFFAERTSKTLPVHSLKGLLGHAGWAAGAASVIAASEYLRAGMFPAQAGFRKSAPAVGKAEGVLNVPTAATPLPDGACRIAIDGFGFGGANAHVVLERYAGDAAASDSVEPVRSWQPGADDELVVVALSEVAPTVSTERGLRFDRASIEPPPAHIMLPDLKQDMDISQTLAICLVDDIVNKFSNLETDLRPETSVVLAQSGKTERGAEATMRVLDPRLRRQLTSLPSCVDKLASADRNSRPSGPYTLQCMMPNVASGRAALKLDLHGPNFVVDAGSESLEAAMSSAGLLLRSGKRGGTSLVVIAAIDANPWRASRSGPCDKADEFAVAFAVTTRDRAEKLGMPVLAAAEHAAKARSGAAAAAGSAATTGEKIRSLVDALRCDKFDGRAPEDPVEADARPEVEHPIHVPVWVESPLSDSVVPAEGFGNQAVLAIMPADSRQVGELVGALQKVSQQCLAIVVGPDASKVVDQHEPGQIVPVDLRDADGLAAALQRIEQFEPDVVISAGTASSWDLSSALAKVASDNSLCEMTFLVAQRNIAKLQEGSLELWGIFIDGWDDKVHPTSGALAGFLKSIQREYSAARVGVLCTRNRTVEEGLECILQERLQGDAEREIVIDGQTRLVRRLRRPASGNAAGLGMRLSEESVVVATGGAHGVTAVLVETLLRDYGCTVVAIGRSPLEAGPAQFDDPDVERNFYRRLHEKCSGYTLAEMKQQFASARAAWEAHQSIQQLRSVGGRVEYLTADVTDPGQVAATLEQIASRFGRVDLIVHGAGVQTSKRLEDRTLAEFRATCAVKLAGLHNLVEQCAKRFGRIPAAHILTSAYSVFGNDGQHDYGAANETLDRLTELDGDDQGDRGWSSIAWLAWDGVGMTRGSEYDVLAKKRGLSGLNAEAGQRIFREVASGKTGSAINIPLSSAEHVRYGVKTIPPASGATGGRVIDIPLALSSFGWLAHHKVRSTPTLPGAWILDCMVKAALRFRADVAHLTSVTVQDATFHRFVRISAGQEPNLRVIAEERAGGIAVWMIGDVLHPSGVPLRKDVVYAEAMVLLESGETALQPSLHELVFPSQSDLVRMDHDPYCSGRSKNVELSGPFDCVRDIAIGSLGRCARFVPNQTDQLAGVIPALLVDSAWRVGAMFAIPGSDELYVPVRIGRLMAPIGADASDCLTTGWEIRTTAPRMENGRVRWDRTEVCNAAGGLKLVVEDAFASPLR